MEIIKGTVKDASGQSLVGVVAMVEGTTIGTATEADGSFELNAKKLGKKAVLVFSYIGYKTVKIDIGTKRVFDIVMEEDPALLDELVVVGYGGQKRISVTGAVSQVKTDKLPIGNSSSIATAVVGRLPGLVVVEGEGSAGKKATKINMRGAGKPLILVDGVERDFEDLNMEEVENITVLKDASATAVYGIRGGNGVMLVTTKRGQEGKFKVDVSGEASLLRTSGFPEMINSYQFALLKNEGIRNDRGLPWNEVSEYDMFSPEDLELFKNGNAPYTHPDQEWADVMLNDFGHRERANVTLSGGNRFFRTFVSLGFLNERDAYIDFPDLPYDTKSKYRRYNIRTNIDFDITKTTVLSFDLGAQFSDWGQPLAETHNILRWMFTAPPYASAWHPDGIVSSLAGQNMNQFASILDMYYDRGHKSNHTNQLQFTAKLDQQLDFITKGLKLNAAISYDHSFTNNYNADKRNHPLLLGFYDPTTDSVFQPTPGNVQANPATGEILNPFTGEWISQGDLPVLESRPQAPMLWSNRRTNSGIRQINFRATLGYDRTFNKHNVQALAVFTTNSKSYTGGNVWYVPVRYMEFAARVSYNYDDRYMIEFNGGYNGSEKFAQSKRFGFFPAVSAGWVLTNEKFMHSKKILSHLKIRASYGTTGNDAGGSRFMYYDEWSLNYAGNRFSGESWFGLDPISLGSARIVNYGNPDVSWATNYQTNIGLETKWFDNRLSISGDIFRNDRKGMLMEPNVVPAIVASELPELNMKDIRYQGYEIQAAWTETIKDWSYNIFGNFNFAESINMFIDENVKEYPWQIQTGRYTSLYKGFKHLGFYTPEEIDKLYGEMGGVGTPELPTSSYRKLQAGDCKYEDLNKDGTIDINDQMYFDRPMSPRITYAFGGGFTWKHLSFDLFFQGAAQVMYAIEGFHRTPFQGGYNSTTSIAMGRWTPEKYKNGEKIIHPRMTANGRSSDHNYMNSSLWTRDASYLRLKNAVISYSLENSALKKAKIRAIKFTLSGTNIFTWTPIKYCDPEFYNSGKSNIPPNRVYTLGLKISF